MGTYSFLWSILRGWLKMLAEASVRLMSSLEMVPKMFFGSRNASAATHKCSRISGCHLQKHAVEG